MENLKHTPGEWVARIDKIGIDIIQSNTGFGITGLGNYDKLMKADYNIETAKANAKLIAAAPQLLEALIKGYNLSDKLQMPTESELRAFKEKAQQAINKAIGHE